MARPPDRFRLGRDGGFFAAAGADVLAVLLHAFGQTPESLERVAAVVREEHPAAAILAPRLPIDTFSSADPDAIASGLVRRIDEQIEARQAQPDGGIYRRIILIGHSAGAVMARKIWALAHGATPSAKDRSRRAPAVGRQDRSDRSSGGDEPRLDGLLGSGPDRAVAVVARDRLGPFQPLHPAPRAVHLRPASRRAVPDRDTAAVPDRRRRAPSGPADHRAADRHGR